MTFFWVLPNWYPSQDQLPQTQKWNLQPVDSEKILRKTSEMQSEETQINSEQILFEFDPNQLRAAGWKKLGLNDKTVQTILHYREKGGRFRDPADLKKIWGMPLALANKIMPYCKIMDVEKTQLKPVNEIPQKMPDTILINQVTAAELLLIPGFNKPLAARMVKFRDKLGGFKSIDQVRKTYGLTDSLFQLMAPFLVL
jgi:DNA uptake protein ComE-like DNA-binding protein